MTVDNQIPPRSHHYGYDYDTLVVSHDRDLFRQLSSFLKEFEPERKPLLADDLSSFTTVENTLNHCDVMICDIRTHFASIECGAYAMECIPANALSIGLTNDQECAREILSLPQNLRLAGIIDNKNGWLSNWHKITAIKQAWHNPLMVSRIEEVPVSDVLQMISSGRWNTVVYIEGYITAVPPTSTSKPLRGCISFYRGEPQTAWSWRSAGIEAMFDLLSIKQGVLQMMKNLCTPTIRNIYLQTEEILLSHAVALDESTIPPPFGNQKSETADHQSPFPSPTFTKSSDSIDDPSSGPSVVEPSWWKKNGNRLIELLRLAQPGSFLLRWMNDEELRRIVAKQNEGELFVVYGTEETIAKMFSVCARGFAAVKTPDSSRFPVMRLGRSRDLCCYIAGLNPAVPRKFIHDKHAAAFIPPDQESQWKELLRSHRHPSLLYITDRESRLSSGESLSPSDADDLNYTLPMPGFSWEDLTGMFISVISTLMKIE
jgi:hypothetical protein